MVQITRATLSALVLCAAFVAPAVASASRQLKQAGPTINFPGCSFLSDSEVASSEDFTTLFQVLQASGLNDTLSNLTSPHTVFAPTNDAFADFLAATNLTLDAIPAETVVDLLLAHVVPANVQEALDNADVITLPTLLENANLTIMADDVNSTEVVTVMSYGSEATVVTPAAYACNLIIYGVDGVLVPEELAMSDDEADMPTSAPTDTLAPSSAEAPQSRVAGGGGA